MSGGGATVRLLQRSLAAARGSDWGEMATCAGEAADFSWDRLHDGHWETVPSVWRAAFSLASLLKAWADLRTAAAPTDLPALQSVIRTLDRGLILGGDGCHSEALHELVEELHEYCVVNFKLYPSVPQRLLLEQPTHANEDESSATEDEALLAKDTPSFLRSLLGRSPLADTAADTAEASSGCSPFAPHDRRDPFLSLPRPLATRARPMPRLHRPTLDEFRDRFFETRTPVLITGVVDQWPAFGLWADWLHLKRRAGLRTVPVEVGRSYMARDFGLQLVTLAEYIDAHVTTSPNPRGPPGAYLAQHPLLDQIRPLARDVETPEYCRVSGDGPVIQNVWLGPANTVSPLHNDKYHNCYAQIVGAKYIRLYDPHHSPMLYPIPSGLHTNTSQVDVDNVDGAAFPHFRQSPYYECEMQAGELLYIPIFWWHYVRATAPSACVSFWFDREDPAAADTSPATTHHDNEAAAPPSAT